jgi:type II secretory pathway pseudopilin PulG
MSTPTTRTTRGLRRGATRGFAMLDVVIGGTIVGTMASIVLLQLGAARDLSTIAARDEAAARIVREVLEARRSLGARAACAMASSPAATVERGGLPYQVAITTTTLPNETSTVGTNTVTLQACEVSVQVTFTPTTGARTVVAATRLYL